MLLKSKLSLSLTLVALFTSLATFAQSIRFGELQNGQITIRGSGFHEGAQSSYQVNIYVDSSHLDQVQTQSGSFSYTTPRGTLQGGENVTAKVLNYNGPGNHYTRSQTIQKTYTNKEIQNYANQQARTVANRVANTYGKLENWRYNFVKGFWSGLSKYDLTRILTNDMDYREGNRAGQSEGQTSGETKGRSDGISHARSQASSDAISRFKSIVDTNQNPDTSLKIPTPQYSGATPALSRPTFDSVLDELDKKLQNELRLLSWSEGGFSLSYGEAVSSRWRLQEIYGYGRSGQYHFKNDWFRSEHAFSEWKLNHLGGSYDHHIWNNLSYSDQSKFESEFKRIYDNVIDQKFYSVKHQYNVLAHARGVWFGKNAGSKFYYEMGHYDGYVANYTTSSRRTYFPSFKSQYQTTFESTVRKYETSPVLQLEGVALIDENHNGLLEPGEKIGIKISKVTNFGRVAATDITPSLKGESLRTVNTTQQSFSVDPSSTYQGAIIQMPAARIFEHLKADKAQSIQIQFGPYYSSNQNFTYSLESLIKALMKTQSGSKERYTLKLALYLQISNEFKECIAQGRNWYRKGLQNGEKTKLARLVDTFKSSSENGKQVIRELAKELEDIQWLGAPYNPFKRRSYAKLLEELTR